MALGGFEYVLTEIHKNYVVANCRPIGFARDNCKTKEQSLAQIPINSWMQFELISDLSSINPEINGLLQGLISRLDIHSPNRSED